MSKRDNTTLSVVDSKSTKPDELSAAVSMARDVLEDDSLTAEARALRIISRIADTTFPTSEARVAMAGEVKLFIDAARGLRMNDDPRGLIQVAARLGQRATELSRPAANDTPHPPRDVNDLPDTCRRGLASCGWSGQEIDWVVLWCHKNQQIIGTWDMWGFTTVSGNRITRQELRENAAPRNELREKFLASLPRILEVNRNAQP